jgi:chromate transporter
MTEAPKHPASSRVTLAALFTAFLQASLMGFGGPLVWTRRIVVARRRWLNDEEFADILSFCQFLPGPNVVSIAVCIGAKFRGSVGALAALAGFIVIPWTAGFGIGALLLSYAHLSVLQGMLRGVAAAAAGLLIGTGIRLFLPHRRRPAALLFAALAFAGLAFAKLPLLPVVIVLVPLSIFAAGRQQAAASAT